MSFKEWTAIVQLAGVVLIAGWLVMDFMGGGANVGPAALAMKLVWAIVVGVEPSSSKYTSP